MGILEQKKPIMKSIRKSKNIFLMAHKNLDLDALGSTIGLYEILNKKNKNCFIIVDEKNHELGVEKILKELTGCINIIKTEDIEENLNKNKKKNLLIICDTNKKELVQSEESLKYFTNKIIIDHHNKGKSTIKSAIECIDTDVSSTCEMITALVEAYEIELDPYYATVLLSGIVLDTNNFTLKTSRETYYSAYYLSCLGASAQKVQYLLKQDISEYIERNKMLTNIEIIDNKIAISKASPYTIYRREEIAKTADTLLYFNNIEASFVISKISKNEIGISARSLGNFDINKILSNFNGGGDSYHGAAVVNADKISQVHEELKKYIEEEV